MAAAVLSDAQLILMLARTIAYRATTLVLPGLSRLRPGRSRDSIAFLMVHGIHEENGTKLRPPQSSISWPDLRANICGVARCYSFISIDEAIEQLSGNAPLRQRSVVLTFDDSLKCFSEFVAPRLAEMGIPAVFYISTEAVEKRRNYWWLRLDYVAARLNRREIEMELGQRGTRRFPAEIREIKDELCSWPLEECRRFASVLEERAGVALDGEASDYPFAQLMNWEDVARLRKLGMTVGSHSASHGNMAAMDKEVLRRELSESRTVLGAKTGADCRHFCYPYGYVSTMARAETAAAGYMSAVTIKGPGWNRAGADPFSLQRFSMPREAHKLSYIFARG